MKPQKVKIIPGISSFGQFYTIAFKEKGKKYVIDHTKVFNTLWKAIDYCKEEGFIIIEHYCT